ncbi:MAG: hypothetical protein AAF611_07215 [Bacteroidota bacterium]
MGKKSKRFNSERFLAIIATLVGIMTLIIFIYQTNIIHEQSRLSVTPRLSTSTEITHQDSLVYYSFIIENKGIGPAIINKAEILDGKKSYDLDFEKYFEQVHPKVFELGSFTKTSSLAEGSTLSPNEKQIMFTYAFKINKMPVIQESLGLTNEEQYPFQVVIDYASIYEEVWRIDTELSGHPKKLD